MKRSEMIKKFHEHMLNTWDIPFNQYSGTYEENWKRFYSDILDFVESEGMLPPEREIVVKAKDRPQTPGVVLLDYIDYENSRENENETD
jgi:hypothetical protein